MMLPFLAGCEHMWLSTLNCEFKAKRATQDPNPVVTQFLCLVCFMAFLLAFSYTPKSLWGLCKTACDNHVFLQQKQFVIFKQPPNNVYMPNVLFCITNLSVVLPNLNLQAHLFSSMSAWPCSLHLTYSNDPASL